jgi:uncharacterized protein involved in exopolysaccharide biosynthesis
VSPAFTLRDAAQAILKSIWIVLPLTLAGAVGGYLFASQLPPRYTAEVKLISDAGLSGLISPTTGDAPPVVDPSATGTLVETLASPVVIQRTVSALPADVLEGLRALAPPEDDAEGSRLGARERSEAAAIEQYVAENLEVIHSGRSYVVSLRYTSPAPDLSAAVANALADGYLTYRADLKQDVYLKTLANLNSEIDELKLDLQGAERTAQTMRDQARLLAVRSEALTGRQQDEAVAESAELFARQREAEREAEATAAVYERLLLDQRAFQTRLGAPEMTVQLFSPASPPLRPSGFNVKPLLLVLGALAGFLVGASLGLLLQRWRSSRNRAPRGDTA